MCPLERGRGQISNDLPDGAESDSKTSDRSTSRHCQNKWLGPNAFGRGTDSLIRTFHFNCSQQSTSSSILCCVSVGNVNHVQKYGEVQEKQRIASFVSTPEYCQLYDIAGEQVVVRVGHLPMTHNGSTSHPSTKDVREPGHTSGAAQRTDHHHVDVQRR